MTTEPKRGFLRRLLFTRKDRKRPVSHVVAIPRNVIASLLATLFEAIMIPVLVELVGMHYMVAVIACMGVATTISFFLNKYWVFEARGGQTPRQYAKQILVAVGSLLCNTALVWVLTEHGGLHYYLSFLCSNVVVFFGWNYPASRWFVFSDGHRAVQ